jgi:hypothetical protein
MRYFAHLLTEKQQSLAEDIIDSIRINDVFAVTVKAFLVEAETSLTLLCGAVTADFREGLQEGLFKDDWTQSKSVAETLKVTLLEYLSDLKVWLKRENDIKVVLVSVLRVVAGSYLEFLLTSGLIVTGGIGERLQQDFEVTRLLSVSLTTGSPRSSNKVFVNVVPTSSTISLIVRSVPPSPALSSLTSLVPAQASE